jgi:hypothetical protein
MRSPLERLLRPRGDIRHDGRQHWRKEPQFGAEEPAHEITFWNTSGPLRRAAIAAGLVVGGTAAALATPALLAIGAGALTTALVWDGVKMYRAHRPHEYEGTVWDAQGNVSVIRHYGRVVWSRAANPGVPPPAGVPAKIGGG